MGLLIQIVVGVAYAIVLEWVIHRYILHHPKWGKKKGSIFSFHFKGHHGSARRNQFFDPDYASYSWTPEQTSLLLFFLPHLLLVQWFPAFIVTILIMTLRYYIIHQCQHRDPKWCIENTPWHYAHHMGPNQDANYGVTTDIIDRIMGTREIYVGTNRFEKDERRRNVQRMRALLRIVKDTDTEK